MDGELEAIFDIGTGALSIDFDRGETARATLDRAWREAWSGIDGSTIRSRVGNKFDGLVKSELAKRFGKSIVYPRVNFRARIEQVLHDIALTELPPAPKVVFAAPAPEDPEQTATKIFAIRFREAFGRDGADHEVRAFRIAINDYVAKYKEQPKKDGKLEHFAFAVNSQIESKGVTSIRPRAGFIRLEDNGRFYDYPQADFMAKYEAALVYGLIR